MITYYWCCPEEDHLNWKVRLACLPTALQRHVLARGTQRQIRQSAYGYWLLQQSLAVDGENALDDLLFTAAGQPISKASAVRFSISHSGAVVGVVVSSLGRIGLDIQAIKSPLIASPVFFSNVEQQAIQQALDPNHCLIQFWSKKEALIKAVGGTMLDWAAQTDVRFQQTIFQGNYFYWLSLPHPQKGVVWLASESPFHNFSARKWPFP